MEKLLVLSDIHGNLEALKTVIGYIGRENFNSMQKLFLGDYVDFGPWPNEVVSFLRTVPNANFIMGNHDLYVIDETDSRAKTYFNREAMVEHTRWSRRQLSQENLQWLRELPHTFTATIGPRTLKAVHADLYSIEKPFNFDNAVAVKEDIILCGHIHCPYSHFTNGKIMVNPGSIGESLDGNNKSSFCIIERIESGTRVTNYRVPYNLDAVYRAMTDRRMVLRDEIINTMRKGTWK